MAEKLSGVNGSIIAWAREYYNMSQEEAAAAIGVTLENYIQWENLEDFPTYAKLKKISSVFRRPTAIFFFDVPPTLPDKKGDLRTLPDSVIDQFSKNAIIQFDKAKAFQLNLMELYPDAQCVLSNKHNFPSDINELAVFIREILQFPIEAQKERKSDKVVFEILREKLYQLGIYVFKDAFKDDSISGLCLYDPVYPVIIINNSMSFARQNFTLMHELYHLISETGGVEIIRDDYYQYLNKEQENIEKSCDKFANAFLVPKDDFDLELAMKPITKENKESRIIELASLYSVSREAIMYKLYEMGIISSSEYNDLKETFYGEALRQKKKSKESGGNPYYTRMSYLGRNYTRDVFELYFSGSIDSVRAGEMLQSKVDHLPKLETAFFRGIE